MNEQQLVPQRPLVRLDLYEQAIILTRFEDQGAASYPVSVHDVAAALAGVPVSSSLLPPETLFWGRREGQAHLGIYVPARRWTVLAGESQLAIPLPPLIFTGRETRYAVYAVKGRPRDERGRLYHAPCPNVNGDGAICQGNTPFPACTPETIRPALHLFLEGSRFNGDLAQGKCRSYPHDVRQLWEKLERKRRFPTSELIPTGRALASLL